MEKCTYFVITNILKVFAFMTSVGANHVLVFCDIEESKGD